MMVTDHEVEVLGGWCRPVLQLSQAELREVERKQRTLAATNQWSVRNRLKATLLRLPQPERRTRADLVDLAALASCACRFIAQHVCSLSPVGVQTQCSYAQTRTLELSCLDPPLPPLRSLWRSALPFAA
jgi:hypothetical protein